MKITLPTLSEYIKACNETEKEIINAEHSFYEIMNRIDYFYRRTLMSSDIDICPPSILLMSNAYMLALSGLKTTLSGHAFSIHSIFRTSLESICYSYCLNRNRGLIHIWLNRNKSKSARDKCSKTFKRNLIFKDLISDISEINSSLGVMINDCYESSIDFGAHPNISGLIYQLSQENESHKNMKYTVYDFTALFGSRDFEVKRSMMACMEYFFIIITITSLMLNRLNDEAIISEINEINKDIKEWGA
ncbi:hypothetical protein ACTVKH_00710 [Serratia marcescens]|uniref:hypothetical protein n=1 Tax=Serratia marcescens TaxID=615 RepID=UPI0018D73F21|nr:hypothetical protein [Serratia marcescens]